MEDLARVDTVADELVVRRLDVGDDEETLSAVPGAAEVRPMPNWIEHPEPGGVNWTIRKSVAPEVRVEPPPEALVERLRAVDVRDGDDDGLELHVCAHGCLPGRSLRWNLARRRLPVNPRGASHLLGADPFVTRLGSVAVPARRTYMRMLFPERVDAVDPARVYADLPHNDPRPAVRLNMIVSVDGGTSWNGVSGALGGPADKALFGVLRSLADVVLVASATMQGEHYGPAVLPAPVQDARRERGQTPVPPIAVVTRTCQFDWNTPFFAAATERPIVLTVSSASEADRTPSRGRRRGDRRRRARRRPRPCGTRLGASGAQSVLAEGGPTLNGQLARAGLLDELCVTLAPLLASGDAKRLIAGSTLDALEPLDLRSICEEDDYLFLRYRPR